MKAPAWRLVCSPSKIRILSPELGADGALQLQMNRAALPHRRLSPLAMMND